MASFSYCVAGLQEAAVRAGVSRSVASRALDIAEPDEKVLRLSEVQPEFKAPIWDYLGFLVDEQRVADGRAMMRQYDQILRAAERRFGVDRHVIAAVWGVEAARGGHPALAVPDRRPQIATREVCKASPSTFSYRFSRRGVAVRRDDGRARLDRPLAYLLTRAPRSA